MISKNIECKVVFNANIKNEMAFAVDDFERSPGSVSCFCKLFITSGEMIEDGAREGNFLIAIS